MISISVSTMLALAAIMLALSILVQIVQEVYKYLLCSKERAYTNALIDFLGPWTNQLLKPGRLVKLQVRGPLQMRRFRPKERLLPLQQEELVAALERTSPTWVRRTLETLRLETKRQKGTAAHPSNTWRNFVSELGRVEKGSPGYWTAYQVAEFLGPYLTSPDAAGSNIAEVQPAGTASPPGARLLDAAEVFDAFRRQFLPHVIRASENFNMLQRNFEYSYGRRNLRQTFTIALILAMLFNLSLQKLYRYATAVPPDQAAALAEKSLSLYQQYTASEGKPKDEKSGQAAALDAQQVKALLENTQEILKQSAGFRFGFVGLEVFRSARSFFSYLLGCLFSALLLSFGAPVWNDLASVLLNVQKARKSGRLSAMQEEISG